MRTSRNGCSGPTHTWRLIFKQSCLLMSAVQLWMVQMDGVVDGHHVPTRLRRQQGGGGVMFWAGIMGRELVDPFRVPEGVKMTSAKYIEFLTDHFLPWYKKKNCAFCSKIIFMHDNAPSHAAKNTSVSLAAMGIKGEKLMVWPPSSPDLNPIENLWSILKRKIFEGGRQLASKQQVWEAILKSCKELSRNSPKAHKFNGCKNCEGYIKERVLC